MNQYKAWAPEFDQTASDAVQYEARSHEDVAVQFISDNASPEDEDSALDKGTTFEVHVQRVQAEVEHPVLRFSMSAEASVDWYPDLLDDEIGAPTDAGIRSFINENAA